METKCAAFWKHTNLRNDNNIFPCCRYKTSVGKFTGDVIEILHLDEYKKLRQDSLDGVVNPNCQKCYYEESLGKSSLRQKFNNEYDTETVELKFLEIGLDNICNLACDGCWSDFSSSWSQKQYPDKPKSFHIKTSYDLKNVPATVNKILFLGGEPLMTKRHYKILELVNDKSLVSVIYNTNGTFLLDKKTIDLLNKFKKVDFIVSIDGYGSLNDKVRSGSTWTDICRFIEQIQSCGFGLSVNTVLHKNNWHGIKILENFIKSLDVPWTVNLLTYPKHLDITNVEDLEKLKEILSSVELIDLKYILDHIQQK